MLMLRTLARLLAILVSAAGCTRDHRTLASLIVTNGTVLTMDAERRVLSPASLVVDAGRIVAVGEPSAIAARWQAAKTIDATGRVVLPGLINTHTHAPMVLYRGLADDLPLMEWLEHYIFPAEAATVTPDFVRVGSRLAALEMIRSGTTTYADMYYFEEEIARVTKEAGLRGVLGQTIIDFPVADAKTSTDGLRRTESFISQYVNDPLITPAVAPHSTYTVFGESLVASRTLALKYAVPLLIHLAETEVEQQVTEERFGERPVGVLDALGLWGPRIVAAHGIWVNAHEVSLLARHQVGIAHNPESNMKLASGAAPVGEYLAAGMNVGLGTDGAASNNDLDMFEAMRQAALLHKLVTRNPSAIGAQKALEMATIEGARVLGLEKHVGSLEVGKAADIIVIRLDRARHTPMYNAVSHLVYVARGDDVDTTIVEGRVLMEGGRVLSLPEADVLTDARRAGEQVSRAVRRK